MIGTELNEDITHAIAQGSIPTYPAALHIILLYPRSRERRARSNADLIPSRPRDGSDSRLDLNARRDSFSLG